MERNPERKLAAHVRAAMVAGQAKMGAQAGGPTSVRGLAPHVQAALAAGQAKGLGAPQPERQAPGFVTPNRELAPHARRTVAAGQARMQPEPTRQPAPHVREAVAGQVAGQPKIAGPAGSRRQVAPHVQAAIAAGQGAGQAKTAGPASGMQAASNARAAIAASGPGQARVVGAQAQPPAAVATVQPALRPMARLATFSRLARPGVKFLFGDLSFQQGQRLEALEFARSFDKGTVGRTMSKPIEVFQSGFADWGEARIGEHYKKDLSKLMALKPTPQNLAMTAMIETVYWNRKGSGPFGWLVSASQRYKTLADAEDLSEEETLQGWMWLMQNREKALDHLEKEGLIAGDLAEEVRESQREEESIKSYVSLHD